MRIAALQYANEQVKHCDDLIEPSQCFLRVFKYVFRVYKSYYLSSLRWLSFIHSYPTKLQSSLFGITGTGTFVLTLRCIEVIRDGHAYATLIAITIFGHYSMAAVHCPTLLVGLKQVVGINAYLKSVVKERLGELYVNTSKRFGILKVIKLTCFVPHVEECLQRTRDVKAVIEPEIKTWSV